MTRSLLFDAVVFDLDGTLVATDRFWVESADRGARRAFRELGLERALPTPNQWMSLVGHPIESAFPALFPDLSAAACQAVLQSCVQEEIDTLRRGVVPAMPEASETVRLLRDQGLQIGIASNCQQTYLDHMLDALALRPLVSASYCRESGGIESKADMLARLLRDFGTRSAVMVGDRSTDRDAAWENGLPHVHCAFGFAQGDERVESEGKVGALRELPELLRRRARWIERSLEHVGAFARAGLRLGITGGPAAGKTLFARDAARLLRERGQPAVALSLTAHAPGREIDQRGEDLLGEAVDLARLQRELLAPHERGEIVPLHEPDLLGQDHVPAGAVLVLEGPHLLGAKLRTGLDRLIHLDVADEVSTRRLRGRAGRVGALAAEELGARARTEQHWLEQRFPPAASADLVLDGTNPLGE